jgi:hypothetical protein
VRLLHWLLLWVLVVVVVPHCGSSTSGGVVAHVVVQIRAGAGFARQRRRQDMGERHVWKRKQMLRFHVGEKNAVGCVPTDVALRFVRF